MTVFEYIKSLPWLPTVLKRGQGKLVYGRPSNSEIRRWLVNRSVVINGEKSLPDDEIKFPITRLGFFPKGQTVTLIHTEEGVL